MTIHMGWCHQNKASRLRRLVKRSKKAKSRRLGELKEAARKSGWDVCPGENVTGQCHTVYFFPANGAACPVFMHTCVHVCKNARKGKHMYVHLGGIVTSSCSCLSVCLSVCLSLSVSVCLCLSVYLSAGMYFRLHVSMYVCLSGWLAMCQSVCVSVRVCVCLSGYVRVHMCIYVYVCMYACMHARTHACMHVCVCMYVSMYVCM